MVRLRLSSAVLAVLLLGCRSRSLSSTARYAPSFQPRGATVAVFGVLQEGNLAPEAWAPISRRLSPALASPSCEIAAGAELERAAPRLYAELEREVAEDGITDSMLTRFSEKTDAVLILTIAVSRQKVQDPPEAPPRPPPPLRPPLLRPRRQPPPDPGPGYRVDMELSASLFSVTEKVSVGRIEVRYRGAQPDEAIRAFASKVGEELGGSICQGWRL